ncbi:hypothetical protein [Burkholderia thailandensis]|uniref:hypothetical protein n=1 Tax=Burkholderia thailandensis TaxID=57975 RepID=UPI002D7738C5|nr:hypothetical protein [Burkholderia thailandensis]WRS70005.1 hypothetical protein U9S59_29890 [Burkholderia thailandensis]
MAAPDWTALNHPEWAQTHGWRAHDNSRINNQDRRINREYREGEIAGAQASAEHHEAHSILRKSVRTLPPTAPLI